MSGNPLNNDNKTDLLFKKFQGVIQSAVDTADSNNPEFNLEDKQSLVNIFQENIFSEPVPRSLPKTLLQLWSDTSISDSSWNTNPGDQTLSFIDLSNSSGALPLRFYKRVYLNNISTTSQSWWLLDPSGSGANSTTNNLLRDTIPYLYNDESINMYRPIVEHWDGTGWQTLDQATYPNKGNWLMDAASGVLQFYDSTANLSSLNINASSSGEKVRPRISFIKYTGAKGGGSGGGGGGSADSFKVGDFSGTDISGNFQDISFQDVSAVLFNNEKFDVSYADGAAHIDLNSSFGNGIADISYYFFDKPNAPFNGDGSLNNTIGTGTITCSWTNPPNTKSALPFGLAPQYPPNQNLTQQLPIGHLPFFKELCIQYKQFFPTISGDWTDISVNVSPKTIIPNTVTELWATSGGTTTDLCGNGTGGNAPYYRVYTSQLQLGKGYQFRIFLKNDSIETGLIDPVYGGDASYNYLYIPNISGGNIELGNFGPPINPFIGDISFINTSFLEFDVRGINTDPSGADASLNTPFPINPALSLRVFYGFDISCVRDPSSIQAHNFYSIPSSVTIRDLPNASGTRENNFTIQGDWETSSGGLISDLSWAPQHNYTINRFFTRNNTTDFSNIEADVSNVVPVVYNTPIPTRTDINTTTNLMPASNILLTQTNIIPSSFPDPSYGDAYAYGNNTLITDIPFLNDPSLDSVGYNLPLAGTFMLTDTSLNTSPLIGTGVSGENLCYMRYDISNAPTTGGAADYDASSNFAIVDIVSTGFDASAMVLPSTGTTQIFSATTKYDDARPLVSPPPGVKGRYHESGGYYLNAIQDISTQQQLINLNLIKFPDICNNNYEPYISRIRQYYNDGSGNFIENPNQRIARFNIALKDASNIEYTLDSSLNKNPTVNLNNFLMGIPRPQTSTLINDASYGYILSNIHNDWRTQLNISQDKLVYRPNGTSAPNFTMTPIRDNTWDVSVNKTIETINAVDFPNTQFDLGSLAQPSSSSARRYSRQYTTSPQFEIQTTHFNNPTLLPVTFSNTYDISFGTPGKDLWWDFTWEGRTQNNSVSAVNLPRKSDNSLFFTSNVSSITGTFKHVEATTFNSTSFSTTDYTHATDLSSATHGPYQLVWANYGFRGAGTSGTNDPYVDFSGTYYNSGSLPTYLGLKTTFDTISESYSPGGKQWWDNTSLTFTLTRTVKYFTFNVEHPYINDSQITQFGSGSTNYGFQLVIGGGLLKDDNSTTGYLVYHKENSVAGGVSIMYDGQGIDGTGNGSWNAASGGTPDAYVIKTSSGTAGTRTNLQITIGVPNSIANAVINSVRINFVKW